MDKLTLLRQKKSSCRRWMEHCIDPKARLAVVFHLRAFQLDYGH